MTLENPSVDVVVAGHRDLFGTPRALEHAGLLRYLVTDLYVGKGSWMSPARPFLPYGPKFFRKLLARDSGLPAKKIVANNVAGLIAWRKLRNARDAGEAAVIHQALAQRLGASVLERKPIADVVVGYRMSDRLFHRLPSTTLKILCQNDGGAYEVRLVREAYRRNMEWHAPGAKIKTNNSEAVRPDWLARETARLKNEWDAADKIACWSNWCVKCLVEDGVPKTKCVVIPPMFQPSPAYENVELDYSTRVFTVIFLGTLCIRKGTHDLIETVSELSKSIPVRLILAGSNQLNPEMMARYKHCIEYRGFVPHHELPSFFAEGHVLALPSYSEGFGLVLLEAMAAGLPVIRSTNTGDVATNGVEGFVVPPGDQPALKDAIYQLANNRDLLRKMSTSAKQRVSDFSMKVCSERWGSLIRSMVELH